ncbi:SRPBCC family protein [Actinomadura latina]|uniref:SRPBCC family protein n=2 Tax=Actinomadura latina TaxID=163603 RepID=A0A846ZF63_9ACTN|nr:SRPBCC family protein [Actinomadura latina]
MGRAPIGQITKHLPGGRRKRIPDLGRLSKNLPKGLPGGKAVGTAGGVLLGAGAAVAAGRALSGRGGEQDSSPDTDEKAKAPAKAESKEQDKSKNEGKNESKNENKDEGKDEKGNGQGVFGKLKDSVGGALPGGKDKDDKKGGKGGGGKKVKVTNIVEHIDVGAPRRLVYDQWTQFQDYPSFMKKVISVDQADETKLNWKAKIFWSARTWESTIVEQVPDDHVVWRSKGPKGHVDGTVSFHELSPNLTRVLAVLEYHPQGFMEKTGNLWRAQGRRARLELKHFRRYVMTQSLTRADEIEGWRGEIRDSEVVRTHEEAMEDEEKSDKTENSKSSGTAAKNSKSTKTTPSKNTKEREEEYEEV